jgi:hypothetical protein
MQYLQLRKPRILTVQMRHLTYLQQTQNRHLFPTIPLMRPMRLYPKQMRTARTKRWGAWKIPQK